jgi:hypothetical protein
MTTTGTSHHFSDEQLRASVKEHPLDKIGQLLLRLPFEERQAAYTRAYNETHRKRYRPNGWVEEGITGNFDAALARIVKETLA